MVLPNNLLQHGKHTCLPFHEMHQNHLRNMLYDYFRVPATRCAPSFFCNDGISSETLSSLKAAAECAPCVQCRSSADYDSRCKLESCVTPVRKASALRCLRNFFLAQLETDSSWKSGVRQDVYGQLTEEIKRVDSEGVTRECQVCCKERVLLRCTLRANGKVNAATLPVLPVLPEAWSIGAQDNLEKRRQLYITALASSRKDEVKSDADSSGRACLAHGSALFYLPSDFLCVACQPYFMALGAIAQSDIEGMRSRCREHHAQDEYVRIWFSRLGFKRHSPNIDQTMAVLEEAQRFARRQLLLRTNDFEIFKRGLEGGGFLQTTVTEHLPPRARNSLPAVEFWEQPALQSVFTCQSEFGIESNTKGEFFANAVMLKDSPRSWRVYTGSPGYCDFELFCLRLWVIICGGFCGARLSEDCKKFI